MKRNIRNWLVSLKKNTANVDEDGCIDSDNESLPQCVSVCFTDRGHIRPKSNPGMTVSVQLTKDDPLMKPPKRKGLRFWKR